MTDAKPEPLKSRILIALLILAAITFTCWNAVQLRNALMQTHAEQEQRCLQRYNVLHAMVRIHGRDVLSEKGGE